jgi:flagellar FliJ protein
VKRSTRIEKIADINQGYEQQAGALLNCARSQHQKQEQQLEQLKLYRQEYQQRLQAKLQNSASATLMDDYHRFFSMLDTAINDQAKIVNRSSQQVDSSQQNWLDKKRAVTSMTRAAENIKAQEECVVRANEQKENDELASRLYVLNRAQLKI